MEFGHTRGAPADSTAIDFDDALFPMRPVPRRVPVPPLRPTQGCAYRTHRIVLGIRRNAKERSSIGYISISFITNPLIAHVADIAGSLRLAGCLYFPFLYTSIRPFTLPFLPLKSLPRNTSRYNKLPRINFPDALPSLKTKTNLNHPRGLLA